MRGFEVCLCLWLEFGCPEVTQCGWQDVEIQLLRGFLFRGPAKGSQPLMTRLLEEFPRWARKWNICVIYLAHCSLTAFTGTIKVFRKHRASTEKTVEWRPIDLHSLHDDHCRKASSLGIFLLTGTEPPWPPPYSPASPSPPPPFPPPHPLPSKAVVTVVLLSKQTNHLFCFSWYHNSTSFFFWTFSRPLPFTQHIVHFTPPAINDHIKGNKLNQSCFKLGCHVVCIHRCKAVQNTQKLNKVITVLETQVGHKSARSRWKFRPSFFSFSSYNCHEIVIKFLGIYFMDLASLWICSGFLWAHLLSTWEPRADKCSPFKTWSRSEYSHTFSHC